MENSSLWFHSSSFYSFLLGERPFNPQCVLTVIVQAEGDLTLHQMCKTRLSSLQSSYSVYSWCVGQHLTHHQSVVTCCCCCVLLILQEHCDCWNLLWTSSLSTCPLPATGTYILERMQRIFGGRERSSVRMR